MAGVPEWAQGVFWLIFVLGLALSVLIPRFGFLHGRDVAKQAQQGGQPSGAGPFVVAAVADPSALNNLATVLSTLAPALAAHGLKLDQHGTEIEKLREELIRTNAKKS
jgi:phosphoglycerol transferase MdoB-like AlkP superfamily enzyme